MLLGRGWKRRLDGDVDLGGRSVRMVCQGSLKDNGRWVGHRQRSRDDQAG